MRGLGAGDADAVIVGAGLAGLAAADRLRRTGRTPVVLESTDRPGGRVRTGTLGGEVFEEGALFFGPNYPVLRSHLRSNGLDTRLELYDTRHMPGFEVGRSVPGSLAMFLGMRDLPVREKLSLALLCTRMAPLLPQIRDSLDGAVSSDRLRRLESVNAEEFLTSGVGPRFTRLIADPVLESLGFAPSRSWSALGALQVLAFAVMGDLYGLRDGNARLPMALSEDVELRTGTRVVGVRPGPAGVDVEIAGSGGPDRVRCRDLVLAIPAPAAADLLGGRLGEAVGEFHYSSSVVPAVALRDLDAELPAVALFARPDSDSRICGLVARRSGPHAPVVCFGALREPWQYELFDAPDEEAVRVLTDLLEEAHGSDVDVIESRVVRWRHAVPITDPGAFARRRRVLVAAGEIPHVTLAGDWLTSPSMEGAVVSGCRAAEALVGD